MTAPNITAYVGPNSRPGGEDSLLTTVQKIDANVQNVYAKILVATATLDFPSTAAGAIADLTISVPGAALGDAVILGVPNGSQTATATFSAFVSAADTVKVRYSPKATEDPASGTFKVYVIQL